MSGSVRGSGGSSPGLLDLGLWHMPITKAPYLCIEPWLSLTSMADMITAIEEKVELVMLLPGETYRNTWSITCRV